MELAHKVIELTGSTSEINRNPLPQDDPIHRCPDSSLAKRQLGWNPQTSLDDGLKKTIAYFQKVLGLTAIPEKKS
jgi:UDP-glucuronate decarboxylase